MQVDDFDDLVMELARVRFGGKHPWEYQAGWLYHDERNPLARQPLGPAAKDKIVLLCGNFDIVLFKSHFSPLTPLSLISQL